MTTPIDSSLLPSLYTVAEVADHCRVTDRQVRRWISEGLLQAHKGNLEMTGPSLLSNLDQRIDQFEAFIARARRHPLPPYEFNRDGNLHPWLRQLGDTEAMVGQPIRSDRPSREARAAGTSEDELLQRYQALLGLISPLEGMIEECQGRASWIAFEVGG